jgi:glycosyltransferase involved in cell wall biosynthesis
VWRESLSRVPAEAMANGIPVLASDRGALPETLGYAGFVFTIPERFTPHCLEIPTSRDVAPWVAVLERLWYDPGFEAVRRELARAEASRWEPVRIEDRAAATEHLKAGKDLRSAIGDLGWVLINSQEFLLRH